MGSKVASGSMLEEASTTKDPFVVLGIGDIDAVNRRVTFRFAEVPLTHCAGTIPVGKGAVTLSWTKQDGEFQQFMSNAKE